jgi:hypothetical protein
MSRRGSFAVNTNTSPVIVGTLAVPFRSLLPVAQSFAVRTPTLALVSTPLASGTAQRVLVCFVF